MTREEGWGVKNEQKKCYVIFEWPQTSHLSGRTHSKMSIKLGVRPMDAKRVKHFKSRSFKAGRTRATLCPRRCGDTLKLE